MSREWPSSHLTAIFIPLYVRPFITNVVLGSDTPGFSRRTALRTLSCGGMVGPSAGPASTTTRRAPGGRPVRFSQRLTGMTAPGVFAAPSTGQFPCLYRTDPRAHADSRGHVIADNSPRTKSRASAARSSASAPRSGICRPTVRTSIPLSSASRSSKPSCVPPAHTIRSREATRRTQKDEPLTHLDFNLVGSPLVAIEQSGFEIERTDQHVRAMLDDLRTIIGCGGGGVET